MLWVFVSLTGFYYAYIFSVSYSLSQEQNVKATLMSATLLHVRMAVCAETEWEAFSANASLALWVRTSAPTQIYRSK